MTAFWGPYYSQKEVTQRSTEMPTEVEQSTGFHVFELHAPSAGISFFAIICGLIAIGLAYGCYRRCCFARIFGSQSPPANQWIPMTQPPAFIQPPPQPQASDQVQPLLQLLALQAMQPSRLPAIRQDRSPPRFEPVEEPYVPHQPTAPKTTERSFAENI